jgi:DNA-binding response OmpR family regulator
MNNPRRILIIDDDEDDSFLLTEVIKEVDSSVECISLRNGNEGITFLSSYTNGLPDLIFLDLNMPLMDGKSFLKIMLRKPHFKNCPVVIYSTSNSKVDKMETQILGAFKYIVKPTDYNELVKEVRMLLSSLKLAV